jgi:hypothetical protein
MAVLIDYRCKTCGVLAEVWADTPAPDRRPCAVCGADSVRRIGGGALLRAGARASPQPPSGCVADAVPGACALIPEAAGMLSARLSGDQRRIQRAVARQERAIEAGRLDPNGPLTASSP